MSFTVVIPARYASTRLPGKAILDIGGKAMVAHVVDRANESSAHKVAVATDDQRVADALEDCECDVVMTRADHESGSDRIAEVVTKLDLADDEIVVNVQGDEPLIPGKLIDQVAAKLNSAPHAVMSTAALKITDSEEIQNPNAVKVVFNKRGEALYFSRSPIPFSRDGDLADVYRHVGVYAYRSSFLKSYDRLQESQLEQVEKLEQLRVLDNGETIMVEVVEHGTGVGVDTQADLDVVRALFEQQQR